MPKLFCSASLGYGGRRLFCFLGVGNEFAVPEFRRLVAPFLEEETKLWADHTELLEGVGCWHPLFPARYDDVLMAASTVSKLLEQAMLAPPEPTLSVFEQKEDQGFAGYVRANRGRS
jgi:hypothetical protein